VADSTDTYTQLTDHLFGDLLMDAENSQFDYHPSEGRFRRGLVSNARRTMFDPLLDKIDRAAAAWDGVTRLDNWLSVTCGVPDDAYHKAVGLNLIGGMIRRARHPGCVHAETVIFISPDQGTGKSTLTKILALDEDWHTDSLKLGGRQQDMIPQMAGKWVIELGELAGMSKADVEDIKQFMSATSDNYTKKYEAFATDHKRRCMFIGTSNDRRPLADASGNRRFLPVHVQGEINLAWLRSTVELLIGEAAHREAAGETFGIPRELWPEATRQQEAARQMSPVEELCYEWFDRPPGSYFATASDIGRALKMCGHKGRYSAFMDKLGYRYENLEIPFDGRKCRIWIRHTSNRLEDCVRLEPMQRDINSPVEMRGRQMIRPTARMAPPPY
jgi:predicted P-loop ATPase